MTGPRSPQLGRIARLMHVEPAEITGLDAIGENDLRTLHDQINESYFAEGREQFARIAALSKVLPGSVAGKLAERFLPPQLGARTAEQLEPARARDLVSKVSLRYLADLSLALDPARSRPVLQAIAPERVAEVAAELFGRQEYAAVSELAGSVTPAALAAALAEASPDDLVAVVPLLVWTDEVAAAVAVAVAALPDPARRRVDAAVVLRSGEAQNASGAGPQS
jgi:hypothetical protein